MQNFPGITPALRKFSKFSPYATWQPPVERLIRMQDVTSPEIDAAILSPEKQQVFRYLIG